MKIGKKRRTFRKGGNGNTRIIRRKGSAKTTHHNLIHLFGGVFGKILTTQFFFLSFLKGGGIHIVPPKNAVEVEVW